MTGDPVRHGRLTAIEGRVHKRPCKAKEDDVLLRVLKSSYVRTRYREISMIMAHSSEIKTKNSLKNKEKTLDYIGRNKYFRGQFVYRLVWKLSSWSGILNENNTEVYIAVAPEANWGGCKFLEEAANPITEGHRILSNFEAFAAFNSADAVVTLHCVYDPETEEYYGEYKYYLTDYYDFSFARTFEEQIMLGYAKSYELYGETSGVMKVNDNQILYAQIPYLF